MFKIKKIDILLLKSFAGPFLVAFGVALFVLVMQFFWLYIDEIAGKGVSMLVLAEMVGYFSVAMFPMALPIAVLISSVMVLGDLAERYELSSMKSAGVSLLRVIRSLVLVSICVGVFSYICSDFLIPKANLAFKSRLHDIRRTKPTLTLEKGIFNEDFRNFIIRIGDKGNDGETIEQIQINDLTNAQMNMNKIMADSGAMYTSNDQKYFVMELINGSQYQQPNARSSENGKQYTFIRTHFKSWTKIWNMSEFDMNRSDEDRFKTQRSMLSMDQLRAQIDSIGKQITEIHSGTGDNLLAHVERLRQFTPPQKPMHVNYGTDSVSLKKEDLRRNAVKTKKDSLSQTAANTARFPAQVPFVSVTDVEGGFLQTFMEGERKKLRENAAATLNGHVQGITTRKIQVKDRQKDRVKTAYELYSKYSFALVCVLFLFIGAPLGAIIRKGGFGWPVLVSIIFFVVFIFLTIMCRELAESFVMHPFLAAMVPCLVLAPIAAVLTYRSMRDRVLVEFTLWDKIKVAFENWRMKLQKNVSNA
jgi:lipopolysaccharide export system permease protein